MKLHMVDVLGQYEKIKNEIDKAVLKVVKSGRYILGPEVHEFEQQTAQYLGCKHAIGCASGTDALQIALMALDIGPGDEVITTPFTFVATAETIALLGAKPVYVDIREEDFNIDPALIEGAITPRTKAIIPVHLYGQPAEMDAIMDIAQKHNLHVIEDSAQSMGAEYKGRKVGTIGSFGCISFFPSKNLGAYGDAGMIVTNDDTLAEKARIISIHGSKIRYKHSHIGINSRLDTIQAAILSVKMPYLDTWNKQRYEAAERYDTLFSGMPVKTPVVLPDRTHIFHQYTIRVPKRDALAEYLTSKKIPFGIYYPIPLHLQEAYRYLGYKNGDFPVTEKLTDEVISLPMHSELTMEQQEYIVRMIGEYFG
jgi:UDP-2-acetamido-2-deoxy-ribo-hexuluronate aminotransferase